VAYGLDCSEDFRRLYTQSEVDVTAAMAELEHVGARSHAEQLAAQHERQAVSALNATGQENTAIEALRELAQQLLNRDA
jgi:geranylgeranyl pyrophosphate synthase